MSVSDRYRRFSEGVPKWVGWDGLDGMGWIGWVGCEHLLFRTAKMTEKAHSSLGGINVVLDEDNKKLLITEMIGEGEKKVFVCHRCSDLTTLNNARSIDYEELKKNACNHSKLSEILFGDQEIQKKPDGKKNIIDVVKNSSELIAIVFPSEKHGKRPSVIQITSRSKRPRYDI